MMILSVKDLMQQDVSYARADMTLTELAAFLDDEGVHGAPVLGGNGALVGVVSRTDLARAVTEGDATEPHQGWFRMLDEEGDMVGQRVDLDVEEVPGANLTVAEIMTTEVLTADANWSAGQAAKLMQKHGVHRVVVVDRGRVVGILSATDLLRAVIEYEPKS